MTKSSKIFLGEADIETQYQAEVELLKEAGYGFMLIKSLEMDKQSFIQKAKNIPYHKGNIPFLLVVGRKKVSLHDQMRAIEYSEDRHGCCFFDESYLIDHEKTQAKKAYWIFDVDLRASYDIEDEIGVLTPGRFALTTEELISVMRHYHDFEEEKRILAAGSRYIDKMNHLQHVPYMLAKAKADDKPPFFKTRAKLDDPQKTFIKASCAVKLFRSGVFTDAKVIRPR